eukprot:SAG22_NODE_327_length_12278_cov_10.550209_10_plen_104_part_00
MLLNTGEERLAAVLPTAAGSTEAAIWAKQAGVVVAALPLVHSMVLHPTTERGRQGGPDGLNSAGLMQYGVVGGIIVMYASYAVDFWLLQRAAAAAAAAKPKRS